MPTVPDHCTASVHVFPLRFGDRHVAAIVAKFYEAVELVEEVVEVDVLYEESERSMAYRDRQCGWRGQQSAV